MKPGFTIMNQESTAQYKEWKNLHLIGSSSKHYQWGRLWLLSVGNWDCQSVVMIDYIKSGKTVTCKMQVHVYAKQLKNLRKVIKTKRRDKLRSGVLLLQVNAPSEISEVSNRV